MRDLLVRVSNLKRAPQLVNHLAVLRPNLPAAMVHHR